MENKLTYINSIGTDWNGAYVYEFIFTDNIENVEGEDWDAIPANKHPKPPNQEYVSCVFEVRLDIELTLIQNSKLYSFFDSVDNAIALGFDNLLQYEEYPEERFIFNFSDDFEVIKDFFYSKDIRVEIKFSKYEKK